VPFLAAERRAEGIVGLVSELGPPMTIQNENRHFGFLLSGQLTLLGAAILVLLIFAWTYAH
jgi:hypothetical protein